VGSEPAGPQKRAHAFPAAPGPIGAQFLTGAMPRPAGAELQCRLGKRSPGFDCAIEPGRVFSGRSGPAYGGAGARLPCIVERVILDMRLRAGAEDMHQHHGKPGQYQQAHEHLSGREFVCPLQHVHFSSFPHAFQ
jgi:hypothetical protein